MVWIFYGADFEFCHPHPLFFFLFVQTIIFVRCPIGKVSLTLVWPQTSFSTILFLNRVWHQSL